MKQLNFDKDNRIDVPNLSEEFINFPSTLNAYLEAKSDAEKNADIMESLYKEARSEAYLRIKTGGEKVTEAHVAALVDVDDKVKEARAKYFQARRDADTLKNYVESLRAKKDCLIQLGSDRRKEL